jgi:hypothetical protein
MRWCGRLHRSHRLFYDQGEALTGPMSLMAATALAVIIG